MRFALVASLCLTVGCTYTKEYAPVSPSSIPWRVPTQQRLVAEAVSAAVNQASAQARLTQYTGKLVQVEVNGVFPPSEDDLRDYVATQVEGELARAGAIVLPRTTAVKASVAVDRLVFQPVEERKPDVRVVASLDWSGVDYADKKVINGGKVAGMIIVGLLTLGVGAIIWAIADSPTDHITTLDSHVRLTLRTFPTAPGLVAATGSGDGASRVILDPSSSSGHTADLVVQGVR